jgi:hypothetical protein
MTLICKGTSSSFSLQEGRKRVGAPRGAALLHDPSGAAWPKCSVLFMSFNRTAETVTMTKDAGYYLGEDYEARKGKCTLPPRALAEWETIGLVKMIWYTRTGIYAPGRYKHPFGVERKLLFRGDLPMLRRYEQSMRLDLASGCVVNYRGFVWP